MGTTSNEQKMSSERRHEHGGGVNSISSAFAAANPQFEPRKLGKTKLTLERVLGLTCLSNAMLAVNPVTGEIAYAAGCIVVIYNLRRNKQVRYYRVEKTVSCICFSSNGQYLAIGEKGYLPAITIWDGNDGSLCAELQLHKYGISCMAFSKDNKYLVTAGLVHDQHLYVWDLTRDRSKGNHMAGKAIGGAEIHEKIHSMDFCQEGNFFVTVGERHFKFWFLGPENKFLFTGLKVNNDIPEIQHRDAVMSTKSDATYMSVSCGYGACNLKTFAVTSDGVLCCFGASGIMERLVSLEASQGFSLSVTEAYVAVGGSSSIIRLFDPLTLEYRMTLPFGPEFGKANEENQLDPSELVPPHPHRQPAAIGVRITGSHVVALYSDRSMFVYELQSSGTAQTSRSFLFHSGCIRDLQVAGKVKGVNAKGKIVYEELGSESTIEKSSTLPNGTFVSTSDDNTLRFWHLDLHRKASINNSSSSNKPGRFDANYCSSSSPEQEKFKNPYSQEVLHVIYHDKPADFEDPNGLFLGGTCSSNYAPDIHMPIKDHGPVNGLRALALHPNKSQVVVGDKEGNVAVIQVSTMESKIEIGAHNSEVHAVAFSPAPAENRHLLASGGRDRLVHVYDCKDGSYNVVKTLDNHSAAVTGLVFSNDGKKIISCGADKTIVLSNTSDLTRYNSIPFTSGKILDVKLTSDDEYLVASCNNRLDLYSIGTKKIMWSG
jgi:WD40 repeat protein